MNNNALAEIFDNIARLLELDGDNPFRIRAYSNAARNIRALSEDVALIAGRGELEKIPGIGSDLSQKIQEYLRTDKIKFYSDLLTKTPPVLIQMLEIPGVGPKTAKLIYEKLKPKSLDQLENFCIQHKVNGLPGIKEKTEKNIYEAMEFLKKHRARNLLGKALPLARKIVSELAQLPHVDKISYVGSLRRMQETIGDLDILIASKKPRPVMEAFAKMRDIQKVLAKGETKSTVISKGGIQIDLRVVSLESFGAALLYFTGSKAHNIKLRTLASKRRLKINEYGLFNKSGRKLAGRTEEDIYKALGLDFIPPELREDRNEVELAAKGKLPRLIGTSDIRGDFHMHSNWSDGVHEIEAMVEAAKKRRLEYVVLTDHSQSLKGAHGLTRKEILRQINLVKKLNDKMKGITVLTGSEVDILSDGSLDFEDDILAELDFVVASVHSGFKQSKEQLTKRITRAMQNKHVDLIGHPTGRLLGERSAYDVDLEKVFKVAASTATAMEINSHPSRLDLSDIHAKRAVEMGVTLAIDTDSHATGEFENLEYGVATARRAGCERKNILNCLTLDELRKRVNQK